MSGYKEVLNEKLAHFSPVSDEASPAEPKDDAGEEGQDAGETFARTEWDDINLDLWNKSPKRKIGRMSLYEALQKHVQPGLGLAPLGKHEYALVNIKKPASKKPIKPGKFSIPSAKLIHLHTAHDEGYVALSLKRMWNFLSHGFACEVHVKAANRNTKTKALFDLTARRTGVAVYKGQEIGQFDWKTADNLAKLSIDPLHMLHLRPEVIFKAMPEGVVFAIPPLANFEEYVFVLAPENTQLGRLSKHGVKTFLNVVAENTGRRRQIARMKMIEEQKKHIGKDSIPWKPANRRDEEKPESRHPDPPLKRITKRQALDNKKFAARQQRTARMQRREQMQARLGDLRAGKPKSYGKRGR